MANRLVLIIVIFALSTTGLATGSTLLFSNLVEPGDQYGPDGVGIGHTPAFVNPGDYLVYGVPFTPSTTAPLTSIEAPFGVIIGPDQLQVYLAADSGGAPGNVIESFSLTALPAPPGPFPLVTVDSVMDPLLVAGQQYWIVATGGPNTFASWTLDLSQGNGADGGASQIVSSGLAGAWTVGSGSRTGALEVFGNAVPEPAFGGAAGIALMLIGFWRSKATLCHCRNAASE